MTLRTRLTTRLARSETAPSLVVVSDTRVGPTLASDIDTAVHLVTDSETLAASAPDAVPTTVGDVTALETLAPADDATAAVVALRRDRQALLVRQLLRTQFDVGEVVVLLNDPERREALADAATTVVCGSSCLSAALRDAVEQTLPEPTESHS